MFWASYANLPELFRSIPPRVALGSLPLIGGAFWEKQHQNHKKAMTIINRDHDGDDNGHAIRTKTARNVL